MKREQVKLRMVLSSFKHPKILFRVNGIWSNGNVSFQNYPVVYSLYIQTKRQFEEYNWELVMEI